MKNLQSSMESQWNDVQAKKEVVNKMRTMLVQIRKLANDPRYLTWDKKQIEFAYDFLTILKLRTEMYLNGEEDDVREGSGVLS